MKKLAFVINGSGGSGKDTFCDFAAQHYRVRNVSSITPIKEIARFAGWNGEKDPASRAMLAELKAVFTRWSELPTRYVYAQYEEFLAGDEQLMFIHIREPEEIRKFIRMTDGACRSLLVRRPGSSAWGNASDDMVEDYDYDYYYDNSLSLEEMERDVPAFLAAIIAAEEASSR